MGVLFFDSFDHYTTLPGKYSDMYGTLAINVSYGRNSTAGIRNNQHGSYVSLPLLGNETTLYLGVAVKAITLPVSAADKSLFQFRTGGIQCTLTIGADGKLRFYRNGGLNDYGVLIAGPTDTSLGTGVWKFVELKVVFSNTVGECEIKINGILEVDESGLDTCQQTEEYCTIVSCFGSYQYYNNPNAELYYDDFWLANDQFYGDCRAEMRQPNGAGNYTQLTPSAGNNYECVDESPPSTTDYVKGNTPDLIDTYTKPNLATTAGTVKAVAANMYLQKNNAGSKQIAGIARLSGTDLAGSGISVPSSWAFIQQMLDKPGGGSWSISDVNNAEFGVKIIS